MIRFENHGRKRFVERKNNASRLRMLAAGSLAPAQNYWTLLVLNLTNQSSDYVSNLDDAIASVSFQVQNHFQPEWGVGGKLVNKTADFKLYLNENYPDWQSEIDDPDGNTADAGGRQIVDWIVNNEEGIDWSQTGIVYVTDPHVTYGGVHEDEKVNALDIPFAVVGVSDENWSVALSHEVLELLADPWGKHFAHYISTQPITYFTDQSLTQQNTKLIEQQDWLVEVCDAVEANEDGYIVSGVPVSNFVAQAYYNASANSHLDYRNLLTRTSTDFSPFPIRKNGYLSFIDSNTREIYQIFWRDQENQGQPYFIYLGVLPPDDGKAVAQLQKRHPKLNDHHRILKYWRNHRRTVVSFHDSEKKTKVHKRKTSGGSSSSDVVPPSGKKPREKKSKSGDGNKKKGKKNKKGT